MWFLSWFWCMFCFLAYIWCILNVLWSTFGFWNFNFPSSSKIRQNCPKTIPDTSQSIPDQSQKTFHGKQTGSAVKHVETERQEISIGSIWFPWWILVGLLLSVAGCRWCSPGRCTNSRGNTFTFASKLQPFPSPIGAQLAPFGLQNGCPEGSQ